MKSGESAAYLVLEGGVEPPRPHGHTDLNRARLPIPPLELERMSAYTAIKIISKPNVSNSA